jgi:nitrite reductase/ring-hydroxylating ferredoxin subunit
MRAGLPSEALPAGEGNETQIQRVRIGDGHVLVARLTSGEVVAFAPVCPHQFTELDEAAIRDGNLRCPRHGYLYDTRTGENIHPARDTPVENLWKVRPGYLPCYQVSEEDGWISVSDERCPPPASYDPASEERPARGTGGGVDPDLADPDPDLADPDPDLAEGTAPAEATAPVGAPADATAPVGAPAPAPIRAVEQSVKFLSVVSGSTFEIRLPIIPRPDFAWDFDVVGQLLEVIDEQFEPGYSPCHLVRVSSQGLGAATLTCTYATAGGERAEVRTFIVRVQPA